MSLHTILNILSSQIKFPGIDPVKNRKIKQFNTMSTVTGNKTRRNTIIARAEAAVVERFDYTFKADAFDRITICENNNEIHVTFDTNVRFIPLNSTHYYRMFVNLTNGFMYATPMSNPRINFVQPEKITFYYPGRKEQSIIEHVLLLLHETPHYVVPHVQDLNDTFEVNIYDKQLELGSGLYKVGISTDTRTIEYLINLQSGIILDQQQGEKTEYQPE